MEHSRTVEALGEIALATAEGLMRDHGRLTPVVLALSKSDEVVIIQAANLGFGNLEQKDAFAERVRQELTKHQAEMYVMVLEAWISKGGFYPPSQAPDRQEIVCIVGESKTGTAEIIVPILRGEADTFAGFGERFPKSDHRVGRFANLLPRVLQ